MLEDNSEFDEDFVVVEPCSQHSYISIEEVNNSIIAHNIRVGDWMDFVTRMIAMADDLSTSPTQENEVEQFVLEVKERAKRLPGLKLMCMDEDSDEIDISRDKTQLMQSFNGKKFNITSDEGLMAYLKESVVPDDSLQSGRKFRSFNSFMKAKGIAKSTGYKMMRFAEALCHHKKLLRCCVSERFFLHHLERIVLLLQSYPEFSAIWQE